MSAIETSNQDEKTLNTNLTSRLKIIRNAGKFDDKVIDHFGNFLAIASDEELFRMSPLRYAERASTAEHVAIDLFLHAAHCGILDFNWGVLCPSCGCFMTTKSGLRWLQSKKKCLTCYIDNIEPSIDDNIEVAFTVSPAVRQIRFHDFETLDFKKDGLFVHFSTSVTLYPEVHQIIHSSVFHGDRVVAGSTLEIPITFEESQDRKSVV